VYETGLGNLSQQETQLLVHFGKDRTQQWTLGCGWMKPRWRRSSQEGANLVAELAKRFRYGWIPLPNSFYFI